MISGKWPVADATKATRTFKVVGIQVSLTSKNSIASLGAQSQKWLFEELSRHWLLYGSNSWTSR